MPVLVDFERSAFVVDVRGRGTKRFLSRRGLKARVHRLAQENCLKSTLASHVTTNAGFSLKWDQIRGPRTSIATGAKEMLDALALSM